MSNIEENVKTIKYRVDKCREEFEDFGEISFAYSDLDRIENILSERKQDKKRIQELEEDNKRKDMFVEMAKEVIENSILKQKIKDLLTEIQEEYNKVQEQFDCIWNKKSKDDYDRYKLQEFSTMQQQLGFFIGKLEELLEEK